ncbi:MULTISPECIES: type IV pilus biogenesis/stability protein PilW [Acidithiobacillus]|jgi:type IV pilus assembly protein PilF|uniref:Type IV pilus biogenesis protein PilF n=2 Tax=Acidithiobacillus caldus TaxID=33059 RepID=A0A059ZPZ5_ACICK|nr:MULTISPECIES: type IV pilus biogenesis/stability protein PilW [Acidithiobacillus]AIA55004.1 Type IV pilus biogenesis protein PilF [Acidithiobacillus caldus ATCC 51756]MBU2728494.1 type IV pilus biogenesis/stability protein PilW [Acidithiobacillus caldus]MBU2734145.1 type IV pilus biogenesis/stability protein PilW [Acidithiobacillus caldus ATCC 51756]MBU2745607.1 type IV pilus biogenesis/stability protein PilW [Acidithiobacillus caldus]MBU2764582.1 type IV pilus biogenesis/stability protein 
MRRSAWRLPLALILVAGTLSGCGLFSSKRSNLAPAELAAQEARQNAAAAESRGLRAPPTDKAAIYTSLGAAYLQDGHPREAIRQLQLALKEPGNHGEAYNVMALAYANLDQTEAASQAFSKALAADPKNPEYLNNYGAFLVQHKDYAKAIPYLKRATEDPLYATPQFAWTNLGLAYIGLKDQAAARAALARALYLKPAYPPALQVLAQLDFTAGDLPAAYSHVREVLAQEPQEQPALLLAGRIAAAQGQRREAEEYWQRCVNANPYSPAGKEAQRLLLGGG